MADDLRARLEDLFPAGGRARRLAESGVFAWSVIGIGGAIWLLLRLLSPLTAMVPYLVMAWLVVLVLSPAVKGLERLRVPRRLGATVAFVGVALALPAALTFALRAFVGQTRSLLEQAPASARGGVLSQLTGSSNLVLHRVGVDVTNWVVTHGSHPERYLGPLGLWLAHAGAVVLLGGLLGYLFLSTAPQLSGGAMLLIPPGRRPAVEEALAEMSRIVAGYVRARLAVSVVVGVLATVGLWAIGMPFWLVLGFLVGVANLIPTLGSWIGGIPVAFVALVAKGPGFLFAAIAVITVAHVVDGFILSPLLLKRTTKLHPVVVLLSVLAGAELAGLWGVLAAIPVAGVVQFLIRRAADRRGLVPAPA